jgi:hypothetical protein
MKSNGVIVTGDCCSLKWKSMKERYNEISDKLKKVKKGTQKGLQEGDPNGHSLLKWMKF